MIIWPNIKSWDTSTASSDTAKLTGPRTFADKRWVGPVKLMCTIIFNISKIRPKSLFGPVKAQKFLRCLHHASWDWYEHHINLGPKLHTIKMEIHCNIIVYFTPHGYSYILIPAWQGSISHLVAFHASPWGGMACCLYPAGTAHPHPLERRLEPCGLLWQPDGHHIQLNWS